MRFSQVWPKSTSCNRLLCAVALGLASVSAMAQSGAFDLTGKRFDPFSQTRGKVIALLFVRDDCPISSRYAPTIQRLSREHSPDAQFFLVFPDKTETPAAIRKYLHAYRYTLAALRDPNHELVRLSDAHVTPEAAVFDRKGALVYHGRIDNLYEDIARVRPRATTQELDDAVHAAIHGSPLMAKETRAVGCYIADLP
jgi:thiol-disulfide isomerase/thioredoxin